MPLTLTQGSPASLVRIARGVVLCALGSFCAIVGLQGTALAASAASSNAGCVDPSVLAMSLADPALQASFERHYTLDRLDSDPVPGSDDESFLFGMSCDAAASCSPGLVMAQSVRTDRGSDEPAPAPMCSADNPSECDLSPGAPPGGGHIDLVQSLVPHLPERPRTSRPDRETETHTELEVLNGRERVLHPIDLASRIERPPRV